ncbi:uncharacterized protein SAPINGB_P006049 [Magnusiomyces paraingens]|uniref:Pre-mRNA-splicing factor CWC24 n=1 Tax=Magnusiomyces paraingens TaxID=2606893 RepID=A0A5E8C2Z0_9ASCO|nr:uncharacterized protein SAPINGB_P006049 [Saprochaete ingens]VVT58124.1 unnamed protein product [Saprochaete ingens]
MFKKRKISKSSLSQQISVRSKDSEPSPAKEPHPELQDDLPPPQDALDKNSDPIQDSANKQQDDDDPSEPVVKRRRANNTRPVSSSSSSSKPKLAFSDSQSTSSTSSSSSSSSSVTTTISTDPPVVARFGPSRKLAAQNAGVAGAGGVLTDYAPDVCKDYKQTGFCGYGDTCKFLHMREDYAAGWQIDRAWAAQQSERAAGEKIRKEKGEEEDESKDKQQSNVATVCPVCLGPLAAPVITKECSHVFCEKCFLAEFKKRQECKVCGESLSGVVSPYRPAKIQ